MHVQPEIQKSFGANSVSGYRVETATMHYRQQKIYTTETNSKRIGDTIFYKHEYLTMPTKTKADAVEDVGKDLKKAVEWGIPQSKIGKRAIKKLTEFFKKNADAYQNENIER